VARDRASRPEAKPLRLFVAVDVPSDVRNQLASRASAVRERLGAGRWVPPENWHVTMKFLGSTWPRLFDWVVERCGEVARTHRPFESAVSGLGAFPSPRRARVLWAGLEDPAARFVAVADALQQALAGEFTPEKRAFTPHLTVARFDPPVTVQDAVDGIEARSETFPVDRLVLYRSHLRRPAPRYEALAEFPLGVIDPEHLFG
jgi:2'-5' RNA ligase